MMGELRGMARIILYASLGLNLLIVGAAIGAYASGVRIGAEQPAVLERAPRVQAFLDALSVEQRRTLRATLREAWFESRRERIAARQARRQAYETVTTEPYDAAAVRAAFAEMRASDQTALGVFHDSLAVMLGELSLEERRAAMAALRRGGGGPGQRFNPAPNQGPNALPGGGAPDPDAP